MFDAVRNNKTIVRIFLGLITLPFALWGVESYIRNATGGNDLATVGDTKISAPQFQQAWRSQQDRMRQALGERFRPEMMDTPEARLAVLNALIDQRVLLLEAGKDRLSVSDEMLREVIGKIPDLQENGQFSLSRYEAALRMQGMSQTQFEAQLRQDLTLQQLIAALGDTGMMSSVAAEAMLRMQAEERQVAELRIVPEQFADQVKVDAANVQKYYTDNQAQFSIPEQVKAEYVVLSLDALLSQSTVSEAEERAWYDSHKDRYQQPEERRASHILLLLDANASAEEKEKVKRKAEDVLKTVQQSPTKFAELAKQYSQDPVSAKQGGDLGFFARGAMVKSFEDTVFKLKEGEVSALVQSEFGYHIIKLTGIKPGKLPAFEEVRNEIEGELKRQVAARKFAESAENFSNIVYEQSDSLAPVAEKFNLKVQESVWLSRNPDPQTAAQLGPLMNEKLLNALFSEDALKNKRNTEAVEIAPNTLLAARVLEHKPAAVKPFDTVKQAIETRLRMQQAIALAKKAGEEKLADLQKGSEDRISWSPVRSASRLPGLQGRSQANFPAAAMQSIFKTDVQKLPAYVGVADIAGGYTIYKIVKVAQPEKIDDKMRKGFQREYASILAQEDFAAYLASLRTRYKVSINKALLGTKEQQ